MKTNDAWMASGKHFTDFADPGDEIDHEIYDWFLGIMFPVRQKAGGFLCGEPYDNDSDGNPQYLHFTYKNGKFFYMGLSTIHKFNGEI